MEIASAIIENGLKKASQESALSSFEKMSQQFKSGLSDKALEARIEAAAHSACKFFGIPDADIIKGDAIGVYHDCDVFMDNDVFEYNLDQFKDMKCVSFEDMTKIWAHECGHRILGKEFSSSPWAQELGADFFSGVRSEMLGLPTSNFERMLGSTTGSATHPFGSLRVHAIQFGRDVVRRSIMEKGKTPTLEECKKEFADSEYSKATYENHTSPQYAAFVKKEGQSSTISSLKKEEVADVSKESDVKSNLKSEGTEIEEVKKVGGSYGELKKEGWGHSSVPPKDIHHTPSNESSSLETKDGPAIVMDYEDHKRTASYGRSRDAQEYRAKQKELIDQGKFREAVQMDIDDIHEKFGTKYDEGINQMLDYCKELETNKII